MDRKVRGAFELKEAQGSVLCLGVVRQQTRDDVDGMNEMSAVSLDRAASTRAFRMLQGLLCAGMLKDYEERSQRAI